MTDVIISQLAAFEKTTISVLEEVIKGWDVKLSPPQISSLNQFFSFIFYFFFLSIKINDLFTNFRHFSDVVLKVIDILSEESNHITKFG